MNPFLPIDRFNSAGITMSSKDFITTIELKNLVLIKRSHMNRLIYICILLLVSWGCANSNKSVSTPVDDESMVLYLDSETYFLIEQSTDDTYGFSPDNPVKVGGYGDRTGPRNQRRFLNALLGPNGETLEYYRDGSCCGFETPNGILGFGALDIYMLYWEGSSDTLAIYLNMYDKGKLLIPKGLKAKE